MAKLTDGENYKADAQRWLDSWSVGHNGERINYSLGGQSEHRAEVQFEIPSIPATATPLPGGACVVEYVVSNSWSEVFQANVTITSNTSSALAGWTLEFNFPGNQAATAAAMLCQRIHPQWSCL